MKNRVKKSQNSIVFCHLQIVGILILKSTLNHNRGGNMPLKTIRIKNQDSRKTPTDRQVPRRLILML
jgi:hypothetical protein